jgi:phage gpG-like protein
MTNFTITVDDAEVKALLKRLHDFGENMQPIMQDIGEGVMERTKQRFNTSMGPDGVRWLPNSPTTYALLANRLGKSSIRKDGRVNSKGADKLAGKKPLIGESKDLMRQFHVQVDSNSVTIGNSMIYAAMQQFGGTTSPKSMIPNVRIPARPFLPVTIDGQLYPQEQRTILNELNELIQNVINRN